MADNPNTYDDDAFTEASINLMADPSVDRLLDALWDAGASEDNIRAEVDNKLEEWLADKDPKPHVGGGLKPKR